MTETPRHEDVADHCIDGTRTGDEWQLHCDCGWATTVPNGTEDDTVNAHLDEADDAIAILSYPRDERG